jgi:hypothetical protein
MAATSDSSWRRELRRRIAEPGILYYCSVTTIYRNPQTFG